MLDAKKRSCDFKHFLYYIFVTFETFQDAILGADLITPLWGHSAKKCKTHLVESIILSNFCSFACRFQDIIGQIFVIMAPTIPYYLTYDLNNDMIRLISTIETILLLHVFTKYLPEKRHCHLKLSTLQVTMRLAGLFLDINR